MTLLSTIFLFEWQQLMRARWLQVSLLLFLVVGLLSIHLSNRTIESRLVQIDSIGQSYHRDYQAALGRFTDTLTDKGKSEAKNAGLAVMVNYWLPQNAIKPPAPMAALSLGLADIQPWHQQVKYTKSYGDATDMPVSNPMTLFAGNFDLAFVIIYFLPLMVLAYCYNLYSSEKEAGTLAMLTIHGGSIHRIMALKLLFRCLVLATLLVIINVAGFLLAGRHMIPSTSSMLLWCLFTLLNLMFWMAMVFLILAFQRGGNETSLYLVGCWILLLLIVPSLINTYVQSRHPVPMKDEIASYRRHQGEEIWNTPAGILSDSFNLYNPQYASSIDPAKDTLHLSRRYVAGYYELLERRMERVLIPFERTVNERNRDFETLSNWNPPSLTQHWLNILAGNGLASYLGFSRQADAYQKKWKGLLYDFHIPDKRLKPADFSRFPVFEYQLPMLNERQLLLQALYLLVLIIVLASTGLYVFIRKNQAS